MFGYLNIRIWFEYQMGFLFREFNSYKLLYIFLFGYMNIRMWLSINGVFCFGWIR